MCWLYVCIGVLGEHLVLSVLASLAYVLAICVYCGAWSILHAVYVLALCIVAEGHCVSDCHHWIYLDLVVKLRSLLFLAYYNWRASEASETLSGGYKFELVRYICIYMYIYVWKYVCHISSICHTYGMWAEFRH